MNRKNSPFLFLLLLPSLLLSLALSLFPPSFPSSSHFVLVSPSIRALPSAFCPPIKFARLPREGPSCRPHFCISLFAASPPAFPLLLLPSPSSSLSLRSLFCFHFFHYSTTLLFCPDALLFHISVLRTLAPVLFFLLFFPFYASLPLCPRVAGLCTPPPRPARFSSFLGHFLCLLALHAPPPFSSLLAIWNHEEKSE